MGKKQMIVDEDGNVNEEGAHELGGTIGMAAAGAAGGVAGGLAAGAAVGAPLGPVGIVAGAAIGGALGGAAGESIARTVNPTDEELYWENSFRTRPYIAKDVKYDTYRPAYRYGVDSFGTYLGRSYSDVRAELGSNWEKSRGKSTLAWEDAEPATRDAYERLYNNRK